MEVTGKNSCRDREYWLRLVSGEVGETESLAMLGHAAECAACGERLRLAIEIQAGPSGEDQALVAAVEARIDPHRLAESLAARPAERRWRRWIWAPVAAAVAVAVVALVWARPAPERLLARAYTERRTLDFRFPGARHAPLSPVEKAGAVANRSPALLEAEAQIARRLADGGDDPRWLRARGGTELLEWNPVAAQAAFDRVRQLDPQADLRLDEAAAWFERAEAEPVGSEKKAGYYAEALERLSQRLAADPGDTVARFNRAIAEERLLQYTNAISDWRELLRREPAGGWAEEARVRLQALEEKMRRGARREPGIEDQVNAALAKGWPADADELAARLAHDHGDPWMQEMLAARSRPAAQWLAEAAEANAKGDALAAIDRGRRALESFKHDGVAAGIARAALEIALGYQRDVEAQPCRDAAETAFRIAERRHYLWIRTQARIMGGICRHVQGDAAGGMEQFAQSEKEALAAGYPGLYLRALGIRASGLSQRGDPLGALAADEAGLEIYWRGEGSSLRAFQFYSDMALTGERWKHFHFAMAAEREAVGMIAQSENRPTEAQAHYKLATLASVAGAKAEAEAEFQRATDLYRAMPDSETRRRYVANGEIGLAALEAERGALAEPLERLERLAPVIGELQNVAVPLRYYETLGRLRMRRHATDAAESAYEAALEIARRGSNSLHAETELEVWHRTTRDVYRGLASIWARAGRVEAALDLWEEYRGAEGKVAEVRPKLREEAVLTIADLGDALALWFWDARGIWLKWAALPAAEVERRAREFRLACSSPGTDRGAREVYSALIEPYEAELAGRRRLLIEAEGDIGEMPFVALEDSHGRRLAGKLAVVSALVRHGRAAERVSGEQRAIVVSAAELPRAIPLAASTEEAHSIAAGFRAATLVEGSATRVETVEQAMARAQVFHFSGHGSSADGGALLLPGAGRAEAISSARVRGLRLDRCCLAVLSACGTAAGQDSQGIPNALVRAFLSAGTARVVASRWNVDAAATADLMRDFYRAALNGTDVDAALAGAQMAVAAHRPQPYYWAGFAVFE